MNRKILTRLLSVLLVVVMTFGLLPVSASAAWWWPWSNDETQPTETTEQAVAVDTQAATGSGDFYRIVHLDCGRKYFSVDNIKTLIDTMAAYKYNQLQLAFGNGGCRFLLDNMDLSYNGFTMDGDTVKTNITKGNESFNGDTRYLSQSDMDTIIAYAQEKGIEIVPMLNMPGHATAIVHNTSYSDNGNLNVNNETARNYGYALLAKYVQYFKGKGCNFFHFGSDESGYTGTNMTTFLTGCAKVITDAGMTPRAFNDATNGATMPKSVQITYWHQEKNSQTASALANSNYDMINTHGRWYYVIKPAQNSEIGTKYWQGTVNTTTTSVELPTLKAETDGYYVGENQFFDNSNSTIVGNKGTMFCIWCDASQDAYLTDSDVISENKNYGALYQIEKLAEHYWGDEITTDPIDPGDKTVTVNLEVGGTKTFDVGTAEVKNYTANEYIATAMVTEGKAQAASFNQVTSITSGKKYLITNGNSHVVTNKYVEGPTTEWSNATGLTIENLDVTNVANTTALSNYLWTITKSGTGYTVVDASGKYLSINGRSNVTLSDSETVLNVTDSSGKVAFYNNNNVYLDNFGGTGHTNYNTFVSAWDNSSPAANNLFTLYEVVEGTTGNNTLTITGTGEDSTTVVVGDTTYNITVTAPSKTETQVLNYGGSFTLPEGATEAKITSGSGVTIENGKVVAGQADGTATVTCVTKNAGGKVTARYTYKITVSAVNFDTVDPLSVQLWSTNAWIGENGNPSSVETKKIEAEDAYKEEGVLLSEFVPAKGYRYKQDGQTTQNMVYWKGAVLHGLTPTNEGTDYSSSGDDFTRVRYWDNLWQYYSGGEWKTIGTTDTVVAYYMQEFVVSDEITTTTRDYGDPPHGETVDWAAGFTGTGFAVVYPDGTMNRTESEIYSNLMLRYVGANGQTPGIVAAQNNSTYHIAKITATKGEYNRATSDTSNAWAASGSITWEKKTLEDGESKWYDETVVWQTDGSANDELPMVNFDTMADDWTIYKDDAVLILIYLEVIETPDSLTVVYVDDSNGNIIKKYPIDVKQSVTFVNGIHQMSDVHMGEFVLDDDAFIENSSGNPQKFNKNLPTVPGVADKYKSGVFKYVKAELSDDGKTLTLHYVIDESKVKGIYVLDFGLPVNIPLSDFISEDSLDNLTDVTWAKQPKGGTLTYNATSKVLTYTPTSTISGILTLDFTLTFRTGEPGKLTIGVMPASNVLYEANFLTEGTAAEVASGITPVTWTDNSKDNLTALGTQAAHKTTDDTQRYGYDNAYDGTVNTISYWEVSGLRDAKTAKDGSVPLKTTFTGNGFDLIGSCGEDTGRVLVAIKNAAGKMVKAALVDTYLSSGTFNQVPLAHLMMDDTANAEYSVSIYAYGPLKARTTTSMRSAISTFAAPAMTADPVAATLNELGISWSDVEVISVADTLSAQAISENAVAVQSMPAARAVAADAITTYSVTIDGFRVYRSTGDTNYLPAEKDVTYANILDVVNGQITAFVDAEYGEPTLSVEDYEKNGGPQNEIYLLPHAEGDKILVQFKLEKDGQAYKNQPVQVSLRAVDGNNLVATYSSKSLTSVVEMYYQLTTDENGIVTIMNNPTDPTADNLAMLAIGNVKLPAGVTAVAPENVDNKLLLKAARAVITPEPVEPELFTPDTFKVHVTSLPMFRSKIVTLGITVSKDVAYVTVNGRTYTPSQFFSRWLKTVTIPVTETISRSETRTYTIIAYNSDGVASEPIVVKG